MTNKKKYDFETVIDRSDSCSEKWEHMKRCNPDVAKGIIPFSVADIHVLVPDIWKQYAIG